VATFVNVFHNSLVIGMDRRANITKLNQDCQFMEKPKTNGTNWPNGQLFMMYFCEREKNYLFELALALLIKIWSPNARCMVQVPRLYASYREKSLIANFDVFLDNIFASLFEVITGWEWNFFIIYFH
jgi:hypothetical protein